MIDFIKQLKEVINEDASVQDIVDRFEEMLEQECVSYEGDYVIYYHFEGFDVSVRYDSSDI